MNCLAVDFGGTRIKYGLIRSGRVLASDVLAAESTRPLPERLEAVACALVELLQQQNILLSDCAGIGLSYPSVIDWKRARILDHFGKFGDASAFDLRGWSVKRLGLPLAIDNDARMALVGEWIYGAGRDCDNCVMITLGTGIGVSAVIEGVVLRGAHGQGGILGGHTTVQIGGDQCVCGNRGCAESEASTSVISRKAKARLDFKQSALATEPVVDYAAIFRCAANGDACAIALRDHSLEVWSALAVNLIHVFDPERLIFGGGIMGSSEFILQPVREYVSRHAHTPWGRVAVVGSALGDQAALLACEWLVRETLEKLYIENEDVHLR